MKTKLLTLFLALGTSIVTMFAESGTCGANLTWDLTDSVLTISGTGDMKNWSSDSDVPWDFYDRKITSVIIGNSVTSIGNYAFNECSGLTSVTIGNSVTSIGNYAFYGCTGLTSVAIPNSVTSIGDRAFYYCKGLTSITIPNSVTSIGNNAFNECSGLTSVIIGNSVTSIGDYAFQYCTGLTSVTIGNSVTSIGDYAFFYCKGLTSITIPNSVTSIGYYAFCYCTGLTNIICKAVVPPTCGSSAFGGVFGAIPVCVPGNSVDAYKAAAEWKEFRIIVSIEDIENPRILDSGYCGAKGDNLTWELNCVGVLTISGSGDMKNWSSDSDVPWYSYRGMITNVIIGNSVTSIGNCAFRNCSVTSVTIPSSVTSIGNDAFYGCFRWADHQLHVTIPNSVTSIGNGAFEGCTILTSVTIPNSVTSIGARAFLECNHLKSITCEAVTPPTCEYQTFYNVPNNILIYVPGNSVDAYKTADGWKDFSKRIKPIQAADVNVTDVVAEPTDNSAVIQWPQVDGAYTYELVIKDKEGNIVCTLVFNSQGQLMSIAFSAPARGDAPQKTQTAGFAFEVTGLESGVMYNYTLTAKNEGGDVLKVENGSFTTKAPQGIEDVNDAIKATKVIRDGQVLIQKGEKIFDLRGQEVK